MARSKSLMVWLVLSACVERREAPHDAGSYEASRQPVDAGAEAPLIVCEAPAVRLRDVVTVSRAPMSLAGLKRNDEAVLDLLVTNGAPVLLSEVALRYETSAGVDVIGAGTATLRNVVPPMDDEDVKHVRVTVRMSGPGGWLRVYSAFVSSEAETPRPKGPLVDQADTLALVIGLGTFADDAPATRSGSFSDLVALTLEPCVKASIRCFPVFEGRDLTISMTVGPAGNVQRAEIQGVSPLIAECFRAKLTRLQVPPFDGAPFDVTIPLVMSAQPQALLRVK